MELSKPSRPEFWRRHLNPTHPDATFASVAVISVNPIIATKNNPMMMTFIFKTISFTFIS